MKYLFSSLALAICWASPLAAYDILKVEEYCSSQHSEGPDREWCETLEKGAGELFDLALSNNPSPKTRKRVIACLKKFNRSYVEAQPCLMKIVDEVGAETSSSPSTYDPNIPGFDTTAYCKTVANSVGGSYQIEQTCRDSESGAWDRLRRRGLAAEIAQYCGQVAATVGGSYQILEACADQEERAKANLQ